MDWLSEFLKRVTVSRSFSGAVFVASMALLVGPKWLPGYFEPLPKDWIAPATTALVLTGTLLFFWLVSIVWRIGSRLVTWVSKFFQSRNLAVREKIFMLTLSQFADRPLNLNDLDYSNSALSKLEMLELTTGLERKGLVSTNPYDENLVSLSAEGRKRALRIRRSHFP